MNALGKRNATAQPKAERVREIGRSHEAQMRMVMVVVALVLVVTMMI